MDVMRMIATPRSGSRRGNLRCVDLRDRRVDVLLTELVTLELAREVRFVRGHVEVTVAAEVEEDDALSPLFLGALGLTDRDAIAWFASGAGMMPSLRANKTPASKLSIWSTASASISLS